METDLARGSESDWLGQQGELVGAVRGTIDYYQRATDRIIRYQRWLAIATMVTGILAPIVVTASQSTTYTDQKPWLGFVAIFITASLSILEGLRRIFRYEQRWVSSHTAMMALRQAVGRFYFSIVDTPPGSPPWKDAMNLLRTTFEAETAQERAGFYRNMAALEPQDQHKSTEK